MKRIVIKIGTNLLTDHQQRLDLNNMRQLVYQISDEIDKKTNNEFLIVSSGAITCGSRHINCLPNNVPSKQAAAAIGQILLYQQYYDFFQAKNKCVAQLLVTKDNFEVGDKKENIRQTIETLLNENVIPIINENDSVSTEEIQFGDNDQLSSTLSIHINATKLILLTNEDGLLDNNNQVVSKLQSIGETELSWVNDGLSHSNSRGGMTSKLLAAQLAIAHGIEVTIANGREPDIIHKILNNKPVGTTILSPTK